MNDVAEGLSYAEVSEHLEDLLERAAKQKQRVILTRRGKAVAALVPIADVAFLEAIEDRLDADAYRDAIEAFERGNEPAIAWEKIKADLGL